MQSIRFATARSEGLNVLVSGGWLGKEGAWWVNCHHVPRGYPSTPGRWVLGGYSGCSGPWWGRVPVATMYVMVHGPCQPVQVPEAAPKLAKYHCKFILLPSTSIDRDHTIFPPPLSPSWAQSSHQSPDPDVPWWMHIPAHHGNLAMSCCLTAMLPLTGCPRRHLATRNQESCFFV